MSRGRERLAIAGDECLENAIAHEKPVVEGRDARFGSADDMPIKPNE